MASYIGINPNANTEQRITQTFDGDGSTVAFTLAVFPGSADNMDVSVGGVVQVAGVDYTLSQMMMTFISGAPPVGVDNIAVQYGSALPLGVTSIPSGYVQGYMLDSADGSNLRVAIGLQNGAATAAHTMAVGTTAERPGTPKIGDTRRNTTINSVEQWDGSAWSAIGGGAKANETLLETKHNITTSYTLTTGASALSIGPLSVASGQSLTIPSGESVIALSNAPVVAANNVTPVTTGDQTIYGLKTFTRFPTISELPSMVRLNTANGYGSTNTKIRRFTNVVTNQGSDIIYADSATLGASFTIAVAGVYSVSYNDQFTAANLFGITLNTTAPTLGTSGIPISEIICQTHVGAANYIYSTSATVFLPVGSVIRAHTDGGTSGANAFGCQFTITRVA